MRILARLLVGMLLISQYIVNLAKDKKKRVIKSLNVKKKLMRSYEEINGRFRKRDVQLFPK